jgi:hypothetical protein
MKHTSPVCRFPSPGGRRRCVPLLSLPTDTLHIRPWPDPVIDAVHTLTSRAFAWYDDAPAPQAQGHRTSRPRRSALALGEAHPDADIAVVAEGSAAVRGVMQVVVDAILASE